MREIDNINNYNINTEKKDFRGKKIEQISSDLNSINQIINQLMLNNPYNLHKNSF